MLVLIVLVEIIVFDIVLVLLRIPNCIVLGGFGDNILMLGGKTAGLNWYANKLSCEPILSSESKSVIGNNLWKSASVNYRSPGNCF
jgi:hypothetical protein